MRRLDPADQESLQEAFDDAAPHDISELFDRLEPDDIEMKAIDMTYNQQMRLDMEVEKLQKSMDMIYDPTADEELFEFMKGNQNEVFKVRPLGLLLPRAINSEADKEILE